MNKKPRVSFIFPYRWLKKDKEFFGENIRRQIEKYLGREGVEELKYVTVYAVLLNFRAYEPEKIKISKTYLQKQLKPLIPNGKLLEIHKGFVQQRSRTTNPSIDFNLFF